MKVSFDIWNEVKKLTHARDDIAEIFFYEREVWWCRLGANVGFEQDGKGEHFQRPILEPIHYLMPSRNVQNPLRKLRILRKQNKFR